MAQRQLRLWNLMHFGLDSFLGIAFGFSGIGMLVVWLSGAAGGGDFPAWVTPIFGVIGTIFGPWLAYKTFRYEALWVVLGDKFGFFMIYGGGSRKWSDVKRIKLVWEQRQSEHDREYPMMEVYLKGGKKVEVTVGIRNIANVRNWLQSRLGNSKVQVIDELD